MKFQWFFIRLIIIGLLATACAPVQTPQLLEATPTNPPEALSIWLPPYLPEQLTRDLEFPKGIIKASNEQSASLKIDVGSDALISQWIFALVAPFSTITDEVTLNDLQALWKGNEVRGVPVNRILVDGGTKALFEKLWGTASVANITVAAGEDLMSSAWGEADTWAIIPFESLEPRWKVIRVDGQSPIRKNFDPLKYSLKVPFSVIGSPSDVSRFMEMNASLQDPLFPLIKSG